MTQSAPPDGPSRLLVVGAAAGMGRWLSDHLFADLPWHQVVLVDTAASAQLLEGAAGAYADAPVATGTLDQVAAEVTEPGFIICVAVPDAAAAGVLADVDAVVPSDAPIIMVGSGFSWTMDVLAAVPNRTAVALHPLMDTATRSLDGQTVCATEVRGVATGWLADAITGRGGIYTVLSPERHDRIMTYVLALAHQALLGFVTAVADSGLDLTDELWAARTPLFEALLGLAVSLLEENQELTLAHVQASVDGATAASELAAAAASVRAAATSKDGLVERIAATRDRFSGALFDTVRNTAAATLAAGQSKRATLARVRRLGGLVGLYPTGRPDKLRVGRLVDLTPVHLVLEELLVGPRGEAALLHGAGVRNAKRLGRRNKAVRTRFGIGHVEVLSDAELEVALDSWLAYLRRDIRFLVPESVAGDGVASVVREQRGVGAAYLVSEAVRTGQRAVVIRTEIRVDLDLDETIERLRRAVEVAYAWPHGVSRPVRARGLALRYLGPPGTFSENAARQFAVGLAGAGEHDVLVEAVDSFDDVLEATRDGGLGVLPITSSASGLVSRSVRALLGSDVPLVAGGVVDVAVRFDAYAAAPVVLAELRGATVFSHPQALAQCGNFIRRWGLLPQPCASTTDALEQLRAAGVPAIAIASSGAEVDHPFVHVVEREIDDLSGSITRFLVVGRPGGFDEHRDGSDPTLRSIVLAPSVAAIAPLVGRGPGFDELLSDADGHCLWVSSRAVDDLPDGVRDLGAVPWSPRTPVVRPTPG
ncbi:MAG: prephenate dehydrogenase/arogenate dehydrogenase family protein [Micropruina sp.]|uniref:prephenate dehydratase domain-containing protein n=1 Tax=Micropruina sp. TaxID=2737536 RepID=UPI0039E6F6F6